MTIANMLKYASQERLQDWAARKMNYITDQHAIALDIAGWKIVSKDDDNHLWPFFGDLTGCDCPDWCHDARPKAKVLPFESIEGDKPAEQPAHVMRGHDQIPVAGLELVQAIGRRRLRAISPHGSLPGHNLSPHGALYR